MSAATSRRRGRRSCRRSARCSDRPRRRRSTHPGAATYMPRALRPIDRPRACERSPARHHERRHGRSDRSWAYHSPAMKASLLIIALVVSIIGAMQDSQPPAPQPLKSRVIDWNTLTPTPTRTGQRRDVFDAPTETLDRLHGHITTLNPGENTGPLHRHPQEELVLIKEGTVEVNIDGRTQIAGPGSIVFFAVNENENMTNVGSTPATY